MLVSTHAASNKDVNQTTRRSLETKTGAPICTHQTTDIPYFHGFFSEAGTCDVRRCPVCFPMRIASF